MNQPALLRPVFCITAKKRHCKGANLAGFFHDNSHLDQGHDGAAGGGGGQWWGSITEPRLTATERLPSSAAGAKLPEH